MDDDRVGGALRFGAATGETGENKSRADGMLDHVVGSAQNLYGRARNQVRDIAEDAPFLARQTGVRLRTAAKRSARVADDGARDHPFVIAAVAGILAYTLAWLVHGRRTEA